MAVFTHIDTKTLSNWLLSRPCGQLLSHTGIESGIENTNYFVHTTTGEYVLTIFEKLQASELPFYLQLMAHLSRNGLAVAAPIADATGALFSELSGKPACIVPKLSGKSVSNPNAAQCKAIGVWLGTAHLAVQTIDAFQENPRGLNWLKNIPIALQGHCDPTVLHALNAEIAYQQNVHTAFQTNPLPSGVVHADLFRDNALMQGDDLGGVIDFYFAGRDTFVYDLCITANDWCINHQTGELLPNLIDALLLGYESQRVLTQAERAQWQNSLRRAALRFWASRLMDFHLPRKAEVLHVKDPTHFERILKLRQTHCYSPWDAKP